MTYCRLVKMSLVVGLWTELSAALCLWTEARKLSRRDRYASGMDAGGFSLVIMSAGASVLGPARALDRARVIAFGENVAALTIFSGVEAAESGGDGRYDGPYLRPSWGDSFDLVLIVRGEEREGGRLSRAGGL